MHFPSGSQKPPPCTKLRNPSDLVDQFLFFGSAFLFIPHDAVLRFPVNVDSPRKHRNGTR